MKNLKWVVLAAVAAFTVTLWALLDDIDQAVRKLIRD